VAAFCFVPYSRSKGDVALRSRKGEEQDATITQLKSAVAQQQKEIKALTAALKEQASQIQKVSD
jgi:uncharacterized coiled-coil protein SlyX